MLKIRRERGKARRVAWRVTLPPLLTESVIPFLAGSGSISMAVSAPGGIAPEYLSRINVDRVAFPHTDVTIGDTSKHEHTTTDYTTKSAELVGDLIERGLEVKNAVEGLRISRDVIIQTEARHGQQGVAKKSEAIRKRKGCRRRLRREAQTRARRMSSLTALIGNHWCNIYTLT